jgi:hypothetical protein
MLACSTSDLLPTGALTLCRQPALGPTNAIRLSLLRAKQQELECLRDVLADVQAKNDALQGQMAERQRQAQELIAKAQVGSGGGMPFVLAWQHVWTTAACTAYHQMVAPCATCMGAVA